MLFNTNNNGEIYHATKKNHFILTSGNSGAICELKNYRKISNNTEIGLNLFVKIKSQNCSKKKKAIRNISPNLSKNIFENTVFC